MKMTLFKTIGLYFLMLFFNSILVAQTAPVELDSINSKPIINRYSIKSYTPQSKQVYFFLIGKYSPEVLEYLERELNTNSYLSNVSIFNKDEIKTEYRITYKTKNTNDSKEWIESYIKELLTNY
jgi:hypothetical protein